MQAKVEKRNGEKGTVYASTEFLPIKKRLSRRHDTA